jgi:hypothetical protein
MSPPVVQGDSKEALFAQLTDNSPLALRRCFCDRFAHCRQTPTLTTDKGTMKDYYGLLGVAPDASAEIIKSAYRKKAAQFHPDRNPEPDAASKFRAVQEAYEVLADLDRRKV